MTILGQAHLPMIFSPNSVFCMHSFFGCVLKLNSSHVIDITL
jgi:hypothetical protein